LHQTKSDLTLALQLLRGIVRLDPHFTLAFGNIANTALVLYRSYNRSTELLNKAESGSDQNTELRRRDGTLFLDHEQKSAFVVMISKMHSCMRKRAVEIDPTFALGYDALGFAYKALGMKEEEVWSRVEQVRLQENNKEAHFNLLVALSDFGDRERLHDAARNAIPVFQRYTRLNPDDYYARVEFANVLQMAERNEEALTKANELAVLEVLDGSSLYNLAVSIFMLKCGHKVFNASWRC